MALLIRSWKVLLAYLTVYIVWGSTYLFIKWSVLSLPPFAVLAIRFFICGALFLIIAAFSGKMKPFPTGRQILSACLLGTLLLLLGNGFVTVAEMHVDSYLAAILISTTPLVVAFLCWILYKDRVGVWGLIGMFLGVAGVALLLSGSVTMIRFDPFLFMVFAGLFCWSLAVALGKKLPVHHDNLVNSGIQMLFVGIVAIILVLFTTPFSTFSFSGVKLISLIGVIYLTLFGGAAFFAFNYLIKYEPASRVVSYALVNPVIAVVLGVWLGNEKPAQTLWKGIPLILAGLYLMLYGNKTAALLFKRGNPPAQ